MVQKRNQGGFVPPAAIPLVQVQRTCLVTGPDDHLGTSSCNQIPGCTPGEPVLVVNDMDFIIIRPAVLEPVSAAYNIILAVSIDIRHVQSFRPFFLIVKLCDCPIWPGRGGIVGNISEIETLAPVMPEGQFHLAVAIKIAEYLVMVGATYFQRQMAFPAVARERVRMGIFPPPDLAGL